MPACEVCGRETPSIREISLEGANLRVCNRCAELGEPVRQPKSSSIAQPPASRSPRHSKRLQPYPAKRTTRPKSRRRELVAVEDFSKLIRQAREQRGMSQKDVATKIHERTSVIAKLESGKMSPTIRLARKFEQLFKITLLEEAESIDISVGAIPPTTTLGDVVQIRRKKSST